MFSKFLGHGQTQVSPRSTPCVLLGYPSNHRGYKFIYLSSMKFILSRHVTFDEQTFPFRNLGQLKDSDYFFLDSQEPNPFFLICDCNKPLLAQIGEAHSSIPWAAMDSLLRGWAVGLRNPSRSTRGLRVPNTPQLCKPPPQAASELSSRGPTT